jgi:hypothetical protein
MEHQGGCLCRAVRYRTRGAPQRVTICHCKFCQRATGSAFMVEPIFGSGELEVTSGRAATYLHRSAGSGKLVTIHFCAACGTKLYLSFERFPDAVGVYAGTFDDPSWFECTPANTRHIFLDVAQRGTAIPPGFNTYQQHAMRNDGTPTEPTVFQHALVVGGER